MKLINRIRKLIRRRKLRSEMRLRERCIAYAGDGDTKKAALIYRFIVKGTMKGCNGIEYIYPNLEGVIHQDESPRK